MTIGLAVPFICVNILAQYIGTICYLCVQEIRYNIGTSLLFRMKFFLQIFCFLPFLLLISTVLAEEINPFQNELDAQESSRKKEYEELMKCIQDESFMYGTFPGDFMWSIATSAYQIKGGWNLDGT